MGKFGKINFLLSIFSFSLSSFHFFCEDISWPYWDFGWSRHDIGRMERVNEHSAPVNTNSGFDALILNFSIDENSLALNIRPVKNSLCSVAGFSCSVSQSERRKFEFKIAVCFRTFDCCFLLIIECHLEIIRHLTSSVLECWFLDKVAVGSFFYILNIYTAPRTSRSSSTFANIRTLGQFVIRKIQFRTGRAEKVNKLDFSIIQRPIVTQLTVN